jgi:hypothetical protein
MNKVNSNFDGQTIFVGMDVHKSCWNLGIHLSDMFIKNVHQKPNPSINKSCHRVHNQKAKYFSFAKTVAPVFRHSEPANGND